MDSTSSFDDRKSRILAQLSSPGPDASPKGSIDVQIQPQVQRLNEHNDVVTTSSCSGRISVFLEGAKTQEPDMYLGEGDGRHPEVLNGKSNGTTTVAGVGGKGGGGKWLFVSHEPVDLERMTSTDLCNLLFGHESVVTDGNEYEVELSSSTRFVHLKFEAMILHIRTRNLHWAHKILSAALAMGFRESGITNPGLGRDRSCMLAVRTNGLAIDAIIGVFDERTGRVRKLVDDQLLWLLVEVSNARFSENSRKIDNLFSQFDEVLYPTKAQNGWEDKEKRRVRKREEGLKRQRELTKKADTTGGRNTSVETVDVDGLCM